MTRPALIPLTFLALAMTGAVSAKARAMAVAPTPGPPAASPPASYERFRYAAPQAELPVPGAALTGGHVQSGRDVGYSHEWRLSPGRSSDGSQGQWGVFVSATANTVSSEAREDAARWSDPAFSDVRDQGVVSKAQAGLVWRRGGAQASFGYVRRSVKLAAPVNNDILANLPKSDHVAGISFSFMPH
jgi:hypothetical protein